jgi:cytochrome c1
VAVTGARLAALLLVAVPACREPAHDAARLVPGAEPDRGRLAIASYGCGSCHVVPGVRGARGTVGPPLTDFGRRQYIAGALVNTPENLIRWIRDPQAVEPGTVMPVLGVSETDARDIAAYLLGLGTDGLGPPHLLPPGLLHGS